MKENNIKYPTGGAPETLECVQANHPSVSGLDLLEAFTVSQLEWMNQCLGEDYKQKSKFVELAENGSKLLENFSYRIAVAGVQSAGKTTVLNTLLDFPYMPTAQVVTTSCSTSVMYGEKPEIEVSSRRSEHNILIPMESLPEDLFRDMKSYVVHYLIRHYGATSLDCLTEPYEVDYESGQPIVNESMLHMEYSNLKHRAALTLHVLSFYVDQNVESEEQQILVKEVNEKRCDLLKRLKIPEDMLEFDITFRVNSPILKDGLVFVDLPGKGAIVDAGNGMTSHDEVQLNVMGTCEAVMLLFEPQMKEATVEPLDDVINFFKNKQIENNRIGTALIPVLNRMDDPGAFGCKTKIDPLFQERGLNFSFANGMFRISALKAEKRFFDTNPDMPIQYSAAARQFGVELGDSAVRSMLEKGAKESNFSSLYNYLKNYADASRETICLEVLLNIYRSFKKYLDDVVSSLRIKESLLGVFVKNSDRLVGMMERQLVEPIKNEFTHFQGKYERMVDLFIREELPNGLSAARPGFLKEIQNEHDEMVKDLREAAKDLTHNIYFDIILWREKDYGKEYVQPNYRNYTALKSIVENNKYDSAFNYLRGKITELHHRAQVVSTDMECGLEKTVKKFTDTLRKKCDELAKRLRNEGQYGEETIQPLISACDELKSYCNTVDRSVQGMIKALTISETKTVNDALKGAYKVKAITQGKLHKANTDIFDDIIRTGAFKGKTFLVWPGPVRGAIDAIAGEEVKSHFELAFDSSKWEISVVYENLFSNKRKSLVSLMTEIYDSLQEKIELVIDNLAKDEEIIKEEIQTMRAYLSRVKPLLPTDDDDSGRLGLTDPRALRTWEAVRQEYHNTIELLEPYR